MTTRYWWSLRSYVGTSYYTCLTVGGVEYCGLAYFNGASKINNVWYYEYKTRSGGLCSS